MPISSSQTKLPSDIPQQDQVESPFPKIIKMNYY